MKSLIVVLLFAVGVTCINSVDPCLKFGNTCEECVSNQEHVRKCIYYTLKHNSYCLSVEPSEYSMKKAFKRQCNEKPFKTGLFVAIPPAQRSNQAQNDRKNFLSQTKNTEVSPTKPTIPFTVSPDKKSISDPKGNADKWIEKLLVKRISSLKTYFDQPLSNMTCQYVSSANVLLKETNYAVQSNK